MFARFRADVERWGVARAIYALVMKRLERHLGLHLFVINSRPLDPDPPRDPVVEGDEVRVFAADELLAFAADPRLDLAPGFLRAAAARGDVCLGYLERGELVSYVWLGLSESPMEAGLNVRVGEGYSYGYKSFTLASHRGRRLQQLLVRESDRWLTARGYRYNIDYIRTHNYPSITADRRYGNVAVGYAGYLQCCTRVWPFRTSGTRRRGFRFVRASSGAGS